MAEEKKDKPNEGESLTPEVQPDALWSQLRSVVPLRDVELPDDEGLGADMKSQTMGERAEFAPKLSDLQSALKVLLPKLRGYLDVLQVSRVFPDIYNPLRDLLVKDLLMEDDNLSVGEAIAFVNTALSIAIDGEGRIDVIALYGRASETEMEKEKAKAGL